MLSNKVSLLKFYFMARKDLLKNVSLLILLTLVDMSNRLRGSRDANLMLVLQQVRQLACFTI